MEDKRILNEKIREIEIIKNKLISKEVIINN